MSPQEAILSGKWDELPKFFPYQEFDRNDKDNIGRPNWFSIDYWILNIIGFITCDEVEEARRQLRHPPAWFRTHYPVVAKILQDKLETRFFTATDYAKDPVPDDLIGGCDVDLPRAQLVINHVKNLNDQGIFPGIYECAPGNYWLPFALKKKELGFKYFGASLDPDLQRRAKDKLEHHWCEESHLMGTHNIFVCFEMIEHLHDPVEIYQSYLKTTQGHCKTIFLSTPMNTFGGGMIDWYEKDLGHLRAYTPREFIQFAQKYWPEFKWKLYGGHVMCLVGEK